MAIYNISGFLEQLAEERGLDITIVNQIFKETIKAIVNKSLGKEADVRTTIDDSTDSLSVSVLKKVTEEPISPLKEITLLQAREHEESVKVGDEVEVPLELDILGRNAIISIKHLLSQKLKDAEKTAIESSYQKKIGEIVTGSVRRMENRRIIVTIDKAEGILPRKEQIPGEYFRQGALIKAYIFAVDPKDGILLSRTHPCFLKLLFEAEVPEIKEGIIEIKNATRLPGIRAKVAVASSDLKIDPVGACVGVGGSRVQLVVKELAGEKIDVIQWSQNPLLYISRALSGVKILREDIDEERKRVQIVVSEEELPIAIGKNGQNVLLCSKLTGYGIDIISERMYAEALIENLTSLSEELRKKLTDDGLMSAYEILFHGIPRLSSIKGIGEATAKNIYDTAYKTVKKS